MRESVRVAVVQAAAVLFDRAATVEKACHLARQAAAQGARLKVLKDTFGKVDPDGLFGLPIQILRAGLEHLKSQATAEAES